MKRRLLVCVLLGLAALPAAAAVRRHVRVVLDLSISMRANDPGRLAVLSTALLHDLAQPNTSLGETFEVIPFDLDWDWRDPTAPPPVSTQPPIHAQLGRRDDFLRTLMALPYDAKMTYFYPGVLAALDDLEQIRTSAYDIRTIVLVTDGVPESPTRDVELQRIRDELAPRLERHGIRLYVLAFGGEADKNRSFFDSLVRSSNGTSLGEYLVDPRGDQLLSYMLQIFSRSFGYSPDAARTLPGTSTLDLEAGNSPERVAVAVFSNGPTTPRLALTAPPGGSVSAPVGVQSAATRGSYSLIWVWSPDPGAYGLDSDAIPGSVAVLRPTRLVLEVLPGKGLKSSERALAGTPLPLRVRVRTATGARSDPGDVDLSFRTFGERVLRPGATTTSYAWESDRSAPPAGTGTVTPEGRVYDIVAEFLEDPATPTKVYAGYLDVEARRGEAVVGSLAGPHAHRVEVHPMLSISPLPLAAYASSVALERRQRACTDFTLNLNAGRLPHPDKPSYPVRAVLIPRDPAAFDRELNQATFTLDGQPLEFEGKHGPQPGNWYKSRALTPSELLGRHQICVQIGKPTEGDPAKPIELSLAMTLSEAPFDDFRVIRPFTLKVLVSPPTFLERWRLLLLSALAVLTVLALLWYFRDRPQLPNDLGYAVGHDGSAVAPRPLEERSLFARVLGLIGESAVFAPGEDRALGRIRPAGDKLYKFRPARGVRIEAVDGDQPVPIERGLATLAVHKVYRIRSDRGTYLFRMEYR